jgi:hypothetical protein
MDHESADGVAPARCHAERVGHEHGRLGGVDRPADDETRERIEHGAAVDLALARGVLGDVGHPQLIGLLTTERAAHEIRPADPPDAR